MHPNIPGLIRLPVFVLLILLAFVVLGLDAYFVNEANKASSFDVLGYSVPTGIEIPTFAQLGVATSVLTIASLIPILIIDQLRKGAATSFVVVELAWLGFLWVLWLATAADTADFDACSKFSTFCSKYHAAEAMSFLTWLLLMGYWIVLLVHTIIAVNNGQNRIWFTSVIDADFTAVAGGGVAGGAPHGGAAFPAQPQQHQQMMTSPATGPATYPPV
jgi:hypothetical protein